MALVNFEAIFRGGTFGFVEFKLRRNGHLYKYPLVINGSGGKQMNLDPGLYLITVRGVAPPAGAIITITHPTSPTTPDEFQEGPIHNSYVLNVNIPV